MRRTSAVSLLAFFAVTASFSPGRATAAPLDDACVWGDDYWYDPTGTANPDEDLVGWGHSFGEEPPNDDWHHYDTYDIDTGTGLLHGFDHTIGMFADGHRICVHR
jgi:hypothetical protein